MDERNWDHKSDALLQWEKHGNCNFFSSCPRMERPKAKERLENGNETHWQDGNCNFFNNLAEAAQHEGKPWILQRNSAICHLLVCSDMLKFRRKPWQWSKKKLDLAPLAQWNHKSDALLQWEKHGNCNFFNIIAEAAQCKGKLWKLQKNKPCAICLYVVSCSNSAGNLGNGRKKLGS